MSTMTIEGPCWIRYNDGRVAWLQLGWRALMSECKKLQGMDLPGLSLGVPEPVWQPQTREEYEQAVWDAYRVNDRYSPFLAQCGLDGPDDLDLLGLASNKQNAAKHQQAE